MPHDHAGQFSALYPFLCSVPALGESRHLHRHYHRHCQSHYLLYYAADPRPRTAIIWGVVIWLVLAGLFYRFTVWLDVDMAKMHKH